jgi:hypothetical protein
MTLHKTFGLIALLGSGETSLAGGRIFETIAQRLPRPLRIAILETPAGFELNSSQVAGRIADFLSTRLQNYQPVIDLVPARKRGTLFSPDDPTILKPLLSANLVVMGPGSPTYAVRHLKRTLAWDLVRARFRQGAGLVFSSAATIAVGSRVVPVYEIYKVGQEITSPPGLGLFADFGLSLSCVPHWNNTDGGAEVDTSRCFIGMDRFKNWLEMLPPAHTVLGLDEHTGLIIDFSSGVCTVTGVSSVSLLQKSEPEIHPAGTSFPVDRLGPIHCPDDIEEGIPAGIWKRIQQAEAETDSGSIPSEIQDLVDERKIARAAGDWARSDDLRQRIQALGWQVRDTSEGQVISSR